MVTSYQTKERIKTIVQHTLETANMVAHDPPAGNRWFKVNLHVHSRGHDPTDLVRKAREAEIDIIALTEHQTFGEYAAFAAAANTSGRPITILPGIEITAHEGPHVLAIFPQTFSAEQQTRFIGWLDLQPSGDTRVAARRPVLEIFQKVEHDEGGIVIIPHPYTDNIGLLASARKMSTKLGWLDSGHVRLTQIADEKVKYIDRDSNGNWVNRYVLSTAKPKDIAASTYCLAPFNRSDAHHLDELDDGCSWFRMQEPNVEGIKQVACEPRTRISRSSPQASNVNCILKLKVSGGYCNGQEFSFNEGLNCVVGQNHSGKSAVLDFLRFALGHEHDVADEQARQHLLKRLYDILQPDGQVELYLRQNGTYYMVRRKFDVETSGDGDSLKIENVTSNPRVYRLEDDQLVPEQDWEFPIEVYEQGRIHRLRDDLTRQLAMLDEFAEVGSLNRQRQLLVSQLQESAEKLKPWYVKREQLASELAELAGIKKELDAKEKLLPGDEESKWANASQLAETLQTIVTELQISVSQLPADNAELVEHDDTQLQQLFGQALPPIKRHSLSQATLLTEWRDEVDDALAAIRDARGKIVEAVETLVTHSNERSVTWKQAHNEHNKEVRAKLVEAGVESPSELLDRVKQLRTNVTDLEAKKPTLTKLNEKIEAEEVNRQNLLTKLDQAEASITQRRIDKATELTDSLGGQITVTVDSKKDRSSYRQVLRELCDAVSGQGRHIKNRDSQLSHVVSSLLPRELARALQMKGQVVEEDSQTTLAQKCSITDNTQAVLCTIADHIDLLNKLQTVDTPDVPRIRVRRSGETTYADIRKGLSEGEQSAAILTLALQTRTMPLIIDQPEDELGYSSLVHLIVPKMLAGKFSRQLIVVTLNANVPVLADADHVLKMESRPHETGRNCVVAHSGCFENREITNALLELEGGLQAFRFRQHRYSLPFASG